MHQQAYDFVRRTVAGFPPLRYVVEFGGRNVNGSVRPLFADAVSYVSVDRLPGPGVDVVSDALAYVPVEPVDCVVCCEVLEHSPKARDIVWHAMNCLRANGVLILTCAGRGRAPHSSFDGGPLLPTEYYSNIEASDLLSWLEGAEAVVTVNYDAHDLYCVAVKA
jgi:hypothetical protein